MEGMVEVQDLDDPYILATGFEQLAEIAPRQGKAIRVARLFGAADAPRTAIGGPIPASERADCEDAVASFKEAPGGDVFDTSSQADRTPALSDAVAYAVDPTS